MPVFDFKSPGAAASRAIQELLAQRRLEARQEMLDRLAAEEQKNVQTEREAASRRGDESLALQRQQEQRYADDSKFNRGVATENMFSNRPAPPVGTDMSTLDPEYSGWRKKIGLTKTEPARTETNPTEWNPTQEPVNSEQGIIPGFQFANTDIPEREVSIGTPEQQLQGDKQARLEALLEGYNSAPDEATKKAIAIKLIGEGLPAQAFGTDLTEFTEAQIVKPGSGQVVNLPGTRVPVGTAPDVLPFAPQMPAGALPKIYQVIDKDRNTVGNISLAPSDVAAWQVENPDLSLTTLGSKPPVDQNANLSSADILNLTRIHNDFLSAQRAYDDSWFGDKGVVDEAEVAYKRLLGGIAAKLKMDENIVDAASLITNDTELRSLPLAQAVEHPKFQETFETPDEADMADLNRALLIFRGIPGQ